MITYNTNYNNFLDVNTESMVTCSKSVSLKDLDTSHGRGLESLSDHSLYQNIIRDMKELTVYYNGDKYNIDLFYLSCIKHATSLFNYTNYKGFRSLKRYSIMAGGFEKPDFGGNT